MKLDIIIATHNRCGQLKGLLDSLRTAEQPNEMAVRTIVVNNASTDRTRDVVMSYGPVCGTPPVYLFEPIPGKSLALNLAMGHLEGSLVGILDDDERVDRGWLKTVFNVFQRPDVDFISGPYKPDWGAAPPRWLPRSHPAVIGWIDPGDRVMRYGHDFDGIMMGGNCVIRREWLDRVGPFTVGIGKIGATLSAAEDADYFQRLMAMGARGYYIPDLVIYHYIPPERLTKRYHRRWCFFHGVSLGRIDRVRPQSVAYLLGIPRYLFGTAARSVVALIRSGWRRQRDPRHIFTQELRLWHLAGFLYGKHISRPLAPYTPFVTAHRADPDSLTTT